MSREARQIATAVAATAFVAAYVATDALHLPTIWYRPIERSWAVSSGDGIAMGWYGHALAACVVAATTFAATSFALRRARPQPRLAALAVLGCVSAFLTAVVIEIVRAC